MITAPKLDQYIVTFESRDMGDESKRFTKESWDKIKEFYRILDEIEPAGEDNIHILYFKLPRGPIEDYGNYEDYLSWGDVENENEFIDLWKYDYPKEDKWYYMVSKHFTRGEKEFYVLGFNNKIVIQNEELYDSSYVEDISDMVDELIMIAKEIVSKIEKGEYNSDIEANLDKRLRFGTISRKDYESLFEDEKEENEEANDELSQAEKDKFAQNVKLQMNLSENSESKLKPSLEIGRMEKINANDFYNYCLIGYDANKYNRHEGLTAKETYYQYADGRDEGLREIDENSYEEFEKWMNSRFSGGHPWEVCRGGNSTHIDLYVEKDSQGYYLALRGKSFVRANETIRFYNALREANVPVFLYDAEEMLNRILENDKIGIVPDYTITRYQEAKFKDEKIIDFVHLDYEKEDEMIKLAKWKKLRQVKLKQKKLDINVR